MASKMIEKAKVVRYSENPFVADMVVPIKGQKIQLSRMGKDDNILVNQATGEVQGTHITTYKSVDSDQFVKLFTANIALTFDLKAAGIKAFNVLLWTVQGKAIDKDLVPIDKYILEDFLKHNSVKMSLPTLWRGLAELEKAQIIAKSVRQGWYYINPNFCFNGDRIAFSTVIQRKKATKKRDPNTPDLFTGKTDQEMNEDEQH